VLKFADSINHCSLTKYRIPPSFTLLDSSLQDAFFILFYFYGHPVIFLVFEKNGENLKKNLVFKFGDSIDHGSLTKCRISLNFTLIYSSFQDASFDVNSCPVTLLVLEKNEKKKMKKFLFGV
jgi:hypothetical protein